MTARLFLEAFERSRAVTLVERDGDLVVLGRLDPSDRKTLARHRRELVATLRGDDAELKPILEPSGTLGLLRIETASGRRWTHALGDEHADRILTGLVRADEARRQASEHEAARRRAAAALGVRPRGASELPPTDEIELRPGPYPGCYSFSTERGRRYRRLPITNRTSKETATVARVFRTVLGTIGTINPRRCPKCGRLVATRASRSETAPDPPRLVERIRRRETMQERADRLTGFFSATLPLITSAPDVRRVPSGTAPNPPDLATAVAAARFKRS